MRFDLITIFPEFFAGPLEHGIVRRAREAGLIDVRVQDLREFTKDRHRTVDDRPFGGGEGMVMKQEPLFAAVDARVAEHLATEEISIGDLVLSGGELPAMLVVDAVTRLLPGALGNEASAQNESFADDGLGQQLNEFRRSSASLASVAYVKKFYETLDVRQGLLDYPHYTRPAEYRGWTVPEVLIGGNHEEIREWRQAMAFEKTLRNRPDLLNTALLSKVERDLRKP